MSSFLSWLDYSEAEKRKMHEVVSLFEQTGEDTRDELGLGPIRDAFADLFFPGTSTIQTRTRYFLFIPWIYREELEGRRVKSGEVSDKLRHIELRLMRALLKGGESDGVIGRLAKERLVRLPSSIYWQGLRAWEICSFRGSQDQYHRYLDQFYEEQATSRRIREEESEEYPHQNWDTQLRPAPERWLDKVSFGLEKEEAQYLAERIRSAEPQALLAYLLTLHISETEIARADFPWELPKSRLPDPIPQYLRYARDFSEAMHGSMLLYNLILAEQLSKTELAEQYREQLDDWSQGLRARSEQLRNWDRNGFWSLLRGRMSPTRGLLPFVNCWLDLAHSADANNVADNVYARELITTREQQLKLGRARIKSPDAQKTWNEAAGTRPLSYRWKNAQVVIDDIRKGLRKG